MDSPEPSDERDESLCKTLNDRPVIGILAQEYWGPVPNKTSFIAASYVKWIESGGARVMPIYMNQSDQYYDDVLTIVNGVVFPGGAVHIDRSAYGDSGKYIYKRITLLSSQGQNIALWGTCLGMELILYAHTGTMDVLTRCSSNDQALPLTFTNETSRMFSGASNHILRYLSERNVTINYHNWCLTRANVSKYQLNEDFKTLSTNEDVKGFEFVSSLEHREYPIFLTQFHPEKNQFEWVDNKKHHNIPHQSEAIAVSQYLARFFVNQARLNANRFPEDRTDLLIYNSPITYTGNNSIYEQSYLFD